MGFATLFPDPCALDWGPVRALPGTGHDHIENLVTGWQTPQCKQSSLRVHTQTVS